MVTALTEAGVPQLENATQMVGWVANVYPEAGEAVLYQPRRERDWAVEVDWSIGAQDALDGLAATQTGDVALAEAEAEQERQRLRHASASRARTRARRYCKANGLTRLMTLTWAGEGCHDYDQVTRAVHGFFKLLRLQLGEAFPYLWVRERHPGGHGYHVHFALGRRLAIRCRRCDPGRQGKGLDVRDVGGPCLRCTWGEGFVHAKRLTVGGQSGRGAAAKAAGYCSKYVGKAFLEDERGVDGEAPSRRHRYAVGKGFQPGCVQLVIRAPAWYGIGQVAGEWFDGEAPSFVWSSESAEDWRGPPVRVCFWDSGDGR